MAFVKSYPVPYILFSARMSWLIWSVCETLFMTTTTAVVLASRNEVLKHLLISGTELPVQAGLNQVQSLFVLQGSLTHWICD